MDSDEAAQAFVRRESDARGHQQLARHIETLWGARQCRVLRCGHCGLGFADPFVGGDAVFYNLAYPGTPGYPSDRWEFRRTLMDLERLGRDRLSGARCLEVGAGIGHFIRRLSSLGIDRRRILALEYNAESLRILHEQGVDGRALDVRQLSAQPFELIFMFQVVEHLSDLDGVFERLARLLASDGALYLAMPNPDRIDFNEQNGTLRDMPPNHVSRWTRAALETLAARHGLAVRAFETQPGTWAGLALQDLRDYTRRRSMSAGTLASRVYSSAPSRRRKWLLGVAAVGYAARRVPLWLRMVTQYRALGDSIWARVGHASAAA